MTSSGALLTNVKFITKAEARVASNHVMHWPCHIVLIDLYHTMLKQKILPVQPLIQCEAGRAKTKLFVPLGLKMAAA